MLAHVGLAVEPAVFAPHLTQRAVQTVSVAQVRQPISTGSIGAAGKYRAHLRPFHETYGS